MSRSRTASSREGCRVRFDACVLGRGFYSYQLECLSVQCEAYSGMNSPNSVILFQDRHARLQFWMGHDIGSIFLDLRGLDRGWPYGKLGYLV